MSTDPIVAGTDGSARATLAVDTAGELAKALDASVHIVSAHPSTSTADWLAAAGGVAIADAATIEHARMAAEKLLADARGRLEARGISAQTHVCSGDPAQVLITIAEDERAQMIVVGNRGMTGARRILGSVPNSVSHHARCGVLIVSTGSASDPGRASLVGSSIVVGTDGSASATVAVNEAIRLAKALGAELHIASGYKPPGSEVASMLDDAASAARERGVEVSTHAVERNPADALIDVAAKSDASTIVVGSKGMHGAKRFTLGNVPNQISHNGTRNVLIVYTGGPNGADH
jgi:nucleotide-binding universal stress UspA family protein